MQEETACHATPLAPPLPDLFYRYTPWMDPRGDKLKNSDGGFGVPSGFVWKTEVFPAPVHSFRKSYVERLERPA